MRLVALDTTSVPGSLVLWSEDGPAEELVLDASRPFGHQLPGEVVRLLDRAGMPWTGIDGWVVGAGPGALTGLRVGIATMQGFAFATSRPLVAVSALDALAAVALECGQAGAGDLVLAWSDAHRAEVFAALYRVDSGATVRPVELPIVGVPAEVVCHWESAMRPAPVVLVGGTQASARTFWDGSGLRWSRIVPAKPLAHRMARLAHPALMAGGRPRPHDVRPLYVRRPDAEVARDRGSRRPGGETT